MPSDWLPVPHYRQSKPGTCLPACVRMVLAYLGWAVSESEVARLLCSKSFGTPAFHVRRLRKWGYEVIDEIGSLALLRACIEARQPCIVFVRTEALPYWSEDVAHALVVVGLAPDICAVNDPGVDQWPVEVPLEAFLLAWSEFDYRYAVVLPEA